jgi:hypothetical protein
MKNHKIHKNSTTTEAREKNKPIFYLRLTKFENYQIFPKK